MNESLLNSSVALAFGSAVVTFIALFILVPLLHGLARAFYVYTIIEERQCKVYVLFGKVISIALHVCDNEILVCVI